MVGLLTCTMGNYETRCMYGENLHFMIFHCIRVKALCLPHWHILVLTPSNALIARYYTLEEVILGTHEIKGFFYML
jgi:hypothetical protein